MSPAEAQTLPTDLGIPLPCLFSLLLLLEQILSVSAVEPLTSLAKLETMAIIAIVLLDCSILKPKLYCLIIPSISFLLFHFLSSFYPKQ